MEVCAQSWCHFLHARSVLPNLEHLGPQEMVIDHPKQMAAETKEILGQD